MGVIYQNGALLNSMTVMENIALLLAIHGHARGTDPEMVRETGTGQPE